MAALTGLLLASFSFLHRRALIATGTPAGCALSVPSPSRQKIAALFPDATKWKFFLNVQAKRPQYLKIGDVVEARISHPSGDIDLGVQRNVVVGERA